MTHEDENQQRNATLQRGNAVLLTALRPYMTETARAEMAAANN